MTDTESYSREEAFARFRAALASLQAQLAIPFGRVPFLGLACKQYAAEKMRESFGHQMEAEALHHEYASLQAEADAMKHRRES